MTAEGEPEPESEPESESEPTMNLKERCISLSPVSYEAVEDSPSHYSPSPYCQCIMDGFENPDDDELIFSSVNIPEKNSCGTPKLQRKFGNTVSGECVVSSENIPDLSNIGSVGYTTGIQLDNNVSDTYLQSMTNLYNTKLNDDSEILASYIRCKEESYKPIINQFRDNASIITNFVSENQGSISRILSNDNIDSIIDKTDNILSAVPTSDIKDTIDRINVVLNNDKIDSVIDKTDNILSAVPTSDIKGTIDKVNDLTNLFSDRGNIALLIILILVSIFILSLISIGIIALISKS